MERIQAPDSAIDIERTKYELWQKKYLATWDGPLPLDLLKLSRPGRCSLCKFNPSSRTDSDTHLMGKSHDKKVRDWLVDYCQKKNEVMPIKKGSEEALEDKRCKVCDVELTSVQMANTHYRGKSHKRLEAMGFQKGVSNEDRRFGIGKDFKKDGTDNENEEQPRALTPGPDEDSDAEIELLDEVKPQSTGPVEDSWDKRSEVFWSVQAHTQSIKTSHEIRGRGSREIHSGNDQQQHLRNKHKQFSATTQLVESAKAAAKTAQFVCTACEFTGNSEIHYNAHINGKKHSKKLKSLGHHNRLETKTGNQEVGNGGQQAGSAHQDSACKGGRQSAEGDPAKATDWATYKARLNQSPTGVQPKSKSITTSISSKTADEAIKKEAFVARKMAVLATSQESCDERVVGGRMPDGANWGCDNRGVGGGGGSAVQALKRKAGSITSISSKSDFSCEACNLVGLGRESYEAHMIGKQHAKKLKMINQSSSGELWCSTCEIGVNHESMMETHLRGKLHLKNLKKMQLS